MSRGLARRHRDAEILVAVCGLASQAVAGEDVDRERILKAVYILALAQYMQGRPIATASNSDEADGHLVRVHQPAQEPDTARGRIRRILIQLPIYVYRR
mgnify:CR=1 FL=1